MKKMLPVFVVLLILGGGGSFFAGMKYANSKRASTFTANRAAGMSNFRSGAGLAGGTRTPGSGGNARGGFTGGEIISKDDTSLTIKLRDGGSQIIFFSSSTQVMKSAVGSKEDLVVGKTITVTGSANPDGSLTARSLQLVSSSTPR
jgi:hypothetical protein